MTNRIAITLAIGIVGAILFDLLLLDGQASAFLSRKFIDLINLVAFWR